MISIQLKMPILISSTEYDDPLEIDVDHVLKEAPSILMKINIKMAQFVQADGSLMLHRALDDERIALKTRLTVMKKLVEVSHAALSRPISEFSEKNHDYEK